VSWDPNTEPDLAGYRVVCVRGSNSDRREVSGGTSNSVTISGLIPGETYQFSVAAFVQLGLEGPYSAPVSYTIPVNSPPTAISAANSVPEDGQLNLALQGSDPEGTTPAFTILEFPSHGVLSGTPPNLTYRPDPDFYGTDSFRFKTSDGVLTSDAATISINVIPVNDAPTAASQAVTLSEDSTQSLTLIGADRETPNLGFSIVQGPTHGRLIGTAPNLTYQPNPDFYGTDSFTFTVSDGSLTSQVATVSITVTPVNDTPTASTFSFSLPEDSTYPLLLTGADKETPNLVFSIGQSPAHGRLIGTAPNFTYQPNADFNGTDSFTFTVSDGSLTSQAATVSITVTPVNDTPVATASTLTTLEDTTLTLSLGGSDKENSPLSFSIVTPPTRGKLIGTAPNLTYQPDADFHGTDSFVFTVSDGSLTSAPATVSLTVTPVNDAPVATASTLTTLEDTALTLSLGGSDKENSALSFSIVTPPTRGKLIGTAPNLTYQPDADFHGTDSLVFTVSDGSLTSTEATLTLSVTPVNDAPVATASALTTLEDTALTLSLGGSDKENSPLSFSIVTPPTRGKLIGTAPNLTYQPDADFHGTDSFVFTVSDGSLTSAPATLSLTVTPVNDAPVAIAASLTVVEGSTLPIVLSGTDIESPSVQFTLVQQPRFGKIAGTGPNITYQPNPGFKGEDTLVFTVSDGSLTSTPATVTISVTPGAISLKTNADLAVALQSGIATTLQDGSESLLANDPLTDPASTSAELRRAPSHGTAVVRPDGTFEYRNNGNPAPEDTFSYVVRNGSSESSETTVRISILAIQSVRKTGNDVSVQFPVISGLPYRLEFSQTSPAPNAPWQSLAQFTASGDGDASIIVREVAGLLRFYRVVCPLSQGSLTSAPWGHNASAPSFRADVTPEFRGQIVRRAAASTVGTDAIGLQGITWQAGELAPRDGFPTHIAQIVEGPSGSGIGEWWPIASHTTSTLTLSTAGQNLTTKVFAGTVFEIVRLTTIADVFGSASSTDRRLNAGDTVSVFGDARSFSWTLTFGTNSTGVVGYFVTRGSTRTGPFNGSTLTLLPAQPLNYSRTAGTAIQLFTAGRVQTAPLAHYPPSGVSYIGSGFPQSFVISASSLRQSGFIADTDFSLSATRDDFLILPVTSSSGTVFAGFSQYVFFHAGTPTRPIGWYSLAGTTAETRTLPLGAAARLSLVQRSRPFVWLESAPWQ
jgi:hypothetical protein